MTITGVDDSTAEASLLDKEVEYAKEAVFEPEEKEVKEVKEAPASEPENEDLDDIYAQLNALSM